MTARRTDLRSLTRPLTRPIIADHGPLLDFYLDSVNGNDNNDGRHYLRPLRTVAALNPKLAAFPGSVGAARGSVFFEELVSAQDQIAVGAYGSGPRPIFDGSDILSSNGWATVGDGSYSRSVTLPAGGAGSEIVRIWEDGAHMALASSQANCAATPGTFFPSANSGTITLYIHPTTGAPASNGKVYKYPARLYGVSLSGDNCAVSDIVTRNSYHNDGSLVLHGKRPVVTRVRCENGGKHNALISEGAVVRDLEIADYFYTGASEVLVFFAGNGIGLPIDVEGLTITNSVDSPAKLSAFGGHTNTGALGPVTLDNVVIDGTAAPDGFGFGSAGYSFATTTIRGGYVAEGVVGGYEFGHDVTVEAGMQIKAQQRPCIVQANDLTLNLTQPLLCVGSPNGFVPAFDCRNRTGMDITIDGAKMSSEAAADGLFLGIWGDGGGGTIRVSNTHFGNPAYTGYSYKLTAGWNKIINNNHFAMGNDKAEINGLDRANLAAIQGDGLDLNSAVDGDATAACA